MADWLSQLGTNAKHLTERFAEYPAPAHDQQLYYTYEPTSPSYAHGHGASSKHQSGGAGHKGNAAMSALTLLAFLFFLHILQQCLKEHMAAMSTPQVMVVSAGRAGDRAAGEEELDTTGRVVTSATDIQNAMKLKSKKRDEDNAPKPSTDRSLTRIATAQHAPRWVHRYTDQIVNFTDRKSIFDGFGGTMDRK